jgi:hypothetical protein
MKIAVKILVLPGINNKTIEKDFDIDEGWTLKELFNAIKEDCDINLLEAKNCLTILDGEAVSSEKPCEVSLEKSKQLWILPMISGG